MLQELLNALNSKSPHIIETTMTFNNQAVASIPVSAIGASSVNDIKAISIIQVGQILNGIIFRLTTNDTIEGVDPRLGNVSGTPTIRVIWWD